MDLFDSIYHENMDNGDNFKPLLDPGFRKQFPQLHDFIVKLSHRKLLREHGRVTLTAENGSFKIILTDPTGKCSFSILSPLLEEGMVSMENHCANSAIHWYYWSKKDTPPPTRKRTSSTGGGTRGKRSTKK